jgi:hypothetical protein
MFRMEVCQVEEFGCVYLCSCKLHISILKMEAVYTLNRRQYGPNPHCATNPWLNRHQKINLPLFLITQHAMHTNWETSIISQTSDVRYNCQVRHNEPYFIHILFESSFCLCLLYPPTNYNIKEDCDCTQTQLAIIIQPSLRWQHLLGPIYNIIRHHVVTMLAIWQNCIIADLTILGKILKN